VTECAVDGCYDDAMEDGVLCESHEVLEYEDVWPDFHDELPGMWDESDFLGGWADSAPEYASQEPF
jgi:hypothetical protein